MIDYIPQLDKNYHQLFIYEAKKIISIYKNIVVELHHYGNSAIKGLHANQTLNILTVIKDAALIDQYMHELASIGYREVSRCEFADDNGRLFKAVKDNMTFYIMMIEQSNKDAITRRLALRDYLRTHHIESSIFDQKMLQRFFNKPVKNYDEYMDDVEISAIEAKALMWYEG
ncbi:GrpB family protein [Macrococcoides caseolyticum]|uniref:GrpB family protein n=1 Tax=Macrococcoides caseolyticum TaxID=69966 RepID=UPI001F337AEA|nr:GrpB family protein [Macrococcus caseolyticus]MCE4957481.1 GrpB family protein [Macrococcus caseolyticus]